MKLKFVWKIEYSITCLIVFGMLLLILPTNFIKTKEARFISEWNDVYSDVSYAFDAMSAQGQDGFLKGLTKEKTNEQKSEAMFILIKPYLRIDTSNIVKKKYAPHYRNGLIVQPGDDFYFEDLYKTKDHKIVGVKSLDYKGELNPIFVMMFDLNGRRGPNIWGRDIYGINVFVDSKITPLGQGWNLKDIVKDCSDNGTGVACSYYYRIGGGYN